MFIFLFFCHWFNSEERLTEKWGDRQTDKQRDMERHRDRQTEG